MLLIVRTISAISDNMPASITTNDLENAFRLLSGRLDLAQTESVRLVVCGGSALIATGLRQRTTKDVDIVALMNSSAHLISPDPLPGFLLEAAQQVARDLGLFDNWLNNGPSSGEGGLYQMGLPQGIADRLTAREYGPRLRVYFIGRLDQIHFKLYAAADQRDGTHLTDLRALNPTGGELDTAAQWAMTHDVSEGFKVVLKETLRELGHESVAERI